jgi:hypothetical protein
MLDIMSYPSIQMISRGVIFALFLIQRECVQMSLFHDVDQSVAFMFLLSVSLSYTFLISGIYFCH